MELQLPQHFAHEAAYLCPSLASPESSQSLLSTPGRCIGSKVRLSHPEPPCPAWFPWGSTQPQWLPLGAGYGWGPSVAPCDQVVLAGTPRGLEFDAVKEVLLGASGVRGVHDLHLWALTLSHPAVSVHVAVGE